MNSISNTGEAERPIDQGSAGGAMGTGVGGFFVGLLTGIVLAGVVTMLYAPKSGQETRDMLKNEVKETQRMFQNWNNDVKERVNRLSQIIRLSTSQEVQTAGDGHQRDC